MLNKYDYSDTEIIVTETGTYLGQPTMPPGLPKQSEIEQASNLFKKYIYPISYGVDRVYWFGIEESGSMLFDKMALVYDGKKNSPTTPTN